MKFVLGKKKFLQFYFFGDEGNSICHAVTNSVQKVFFAGMPQYLHQYISWVNRPSYVRRKSPRKIGKIF